MPLAPVPMITVMAAAMQTVDDLDLNTVLADLLATLPIPEGGAAPLLLKLRWLRNRYTTVEEKPCVALAFVSDGPQDPQDRDQYPAAGEALRELALDVVVDVELPSEVEVDEEETIADIAGLEILSHIERRVIQGLKQGFIDPAQAPTALSGIAHWVQELGVDNDEDLADFNGRLVSRVNVLYRVRSDDPMVLLSDGG